jgi:tetratricopeptide (TPR) repeat protein
VLILRLKQAEAAVADGRLDEAFDIVQSEQIRQHRRGQKLIGRLARAFAKRGRENLEAERVQLALIDCNKAEKLAGNTDDVARLRSAICSDMEQRRLRNQRRSYKVTQAKRQIQNGWISVGEQILDEADDNDSRMGMVVQQANVARLQLNEAIEKADRALKRNDLDSAIDIFLQTGVTNSKNDRVTELVSKLKSLAIQQIRDNFNAGRIDRARYLWQKVSPIANGTSEISELGTALEQCHKAAEYVAAGRPREAVVLLRKVKVICPSAKWLGAVTEQTQKTAELLDELAASPLGLDINSGTPNEKETGGEQIKGNPVGDGVKYPAGRYEMENSGVDSSLPSRFVMQMDGIGSFLVLRDRCVTVGPISSSARPMVGLMAEPNIPVATIERVQDDYFIRSTSPIRVNDVTTNNKLLVDGDHIVLSPRCRMKFHLPNPASTTAVLVLSGTRLGRADIRQIILMDRDILIGPASGNHIHAEFLEKTVAIYAQNERLLCKSSEKVLVDDKPVGSTAGLAIDKHIRIGQISFVITKQKA